jgi:hypothetical protein
MPDAGCQMQMQIPDARMQDADAGCKIYNINIRSPITDHSSLITDHRSPITNPNSQMNRSSYHHTNATLTIGLFGIGLQAIGINLMD